jgi:hypothetical protein
MRGRAARRRGSSGACGASERQRGSTREPSEGRGKKRRKKKNGEEREMMVVGMSE